ncbi:hypothetical protein HYQ46_010517 [Verticillium longisporum]|nr:hypothetical protein HYQ46_010517 [Verticillium longisporum]
MWWEVRYAACPSQAGGGTAPGSRLGEGVLVQVQDESYLLETLRKAWCVTGFCADVVVELPMFHPPHANWSSPHGDSFDTTLSALSSCRR